MILPFTLRDLFRFLLVFWLRHLSECFLFSFFSFFLFSFGVVGFRTNTKSKSSPDERRAFCKLKVERKFLSYVHNRKGVERSVFQTVLNSVHLLEELNFYRENFCSASRWNGRSCKCNTRCRSVNR